MWFALTLALGLALLAVAQQGVYQQCGGIGWSVCSNIDATIDQMFAVGLEELLALLDLSVPSLMIVRVGRPTLSPTQL